MTGYTCVQLLTVVLTQRDRSVSMINAKCLRNFSIYELNTPKYLTIFLVKAEVIIFMCRDVEDAGETQGSVEHLTNL